MGRDTEKTISVWTGLANRNVGIKIKSNRKRVTFNELVWWMGACKLRKIVKNKYLYYDWFKNKSSVR